MLAVLLTCLRNTVFFFEAVGEVEVHNTHCLPNRGYRQAAQCHGTVWISISTIETGDSISHQQKQAWTNCTRILSGAEYRVVAMQS